MERKFYVILALLAATVGCWYYLSVNLGIDWNNPSTHDVKTGARSDPKDIDRYATKVIKYTKEYVGNTNSEERLYDRVAFINLETMINVDHTYERYEDLIRSGWPVSNQTLCGQHLSWLHTQLREHRNYTFVKGELGEQLTDFMDSFGKPEAGFYHSAINHWIGAYEQCIGVNFKKQQIRTRYCSVDMRPRWWPKNETIYPMPAVKVGICLPETCDTLSLDWHKEAIERLTKYELNKFYQDGYDLVSMYCLPDERSPLRQISASGWTFLVLFGTWFSLVVGATIIYELYYHEKKSLVRARALKSASEAANGGSAHPLTAITAQTLIEHQLEPTHAPSLMRALCQSLSLRRSFKTFKTKGFAVDYSGGQRVRVDLGCLDFFKTFMTLSVVMGHSAWLLVNLNRSPGHTIELSRHRLGQWTVSITLFVDTFFIMFGILFTYSLMRKLKRQQLGRPGVWLGVIARIFIRVTPVYLFVQWYNQSISPYTEAGPLWDYGTGGRSFRSLCFKEPWWHKIPIFSALKSQPWSNCVPPAWFLVSYLQIGFFLPPFTYILCKLPNQLSRLALTSITVVISLSYLSLQLYNSQTIPLETYFNYGSLFSNLVEKFETSGYMMAMSRFGSVCVGCCVGCFLRLYEEGHIASWPKWLERKSTLVIAFTLIVAIMGAPVILQILYINDWVRLSKLEVIVLINQVRPVTWYICNSIVLISLSTTLNHTVVARFCAHNFWYSFNKLGLNIYLLHWEVLNVMMTSWDRAAPYGKVSEGFRLGLTAIFYSILLGGLLHLMIEVPAGNIMTRLDDYLTKPSKSNQAARQKQHASELHKMRTVECQS